MRIWRLEDLMHHARHVSTEVDGRYVPARPLRPSWGRWRAAWLVLTNRADAVVWPEDEKKGEVP